VTDGSWLWPLYRRPPRRPLILVPPVLRHLTELGGAFSKISLKRPVKLSALSDGINLDQDIVAQSVRRDVGSVEVQVAGAGTVKAVRGFVLLRIDTGDHIAAAGFGFIDGLAEFGDLYRVQEVISTLSPRRARSVGPGPRTLGGAHRLLSVSRVVAIEIPQLHAMWTPGTSNAPLFN